MKTLRFIESQIINTLRQVEVSTPVRGQIGLINRVVQALYFFLFTRTLYCEAELKERTKRSVARSPKMLFLLLRVGPSFFRVGV